MGILFNPNFIDSVSGLGYFFLSFTTLYLYIYSNSYTNLHRIIIYFGKFVFIIGLLSLTIFLFGGTEIYKSIFWFNYNEFGSDVFPRFASIYSEPAHTVTILIFLVSYMVIEKKVLVLFSSKNLFYFFLVLLIAFFTFSIVVYLSILLLLFSLYFSVYIAFKIKILIVFITPLLIFFFLVHKLVRFW